MKDFLEQELGENDLEKKVRTWDEFEDCSRGDRSIEEFVSDFDSNTNEQLTHLRLTSRLSLHGSKAFMREP